MRCVNSFRSDWMLFERMWVFVCHIERKGVDRFWGNLLISASKGFTACLVCLSYLIHNGYAASKDVSYLWSKIFNTAKDHSFACNLTRVSPCGTTCITLFLVHLHQSEYSLFSPKVWAAVCSTATTQSWLGCWHGRLCGFKLNMTRQYWYRKLRSKVVNSSNSW